MSSYIVSGIRAGYTLRLYGRSKAHQIPRIYGKANKFKSFLLDHCSVLQKPYCPPFWSFHGGFHTVLRYFIAARPRLPFEREIENHIFRELFKFEDGGQVGLDWLHPKSGNAKSKTRVVLILPALGGSSSHAYVLHMAKVSSEAGYETVVFNSRGNGKVALLTPKIFSLTYTDDLRVVIGHIRRRYPDADILATGFCVGGMVLLNYVSKYNAVECGLKAAMTVSMPWNTPGTMKSLERPSNRFLFNFRLAKNLTRIMNKNKKILEGIVDVDSVLSSQSLREFDERCIVPMYKYKDVLEYYQDSSVDHRVNSVSVPTLCLTAADDCFVPVPTIPVDAVERSENVTVVLTNRGGHLGFMNANSPAYGGLAEDLFSEYAKAAFEYGSKA